MAAARRMIWRMRQRRRFTAQAERKRERSPPAAGRLRPARSNTAGLRMAMFIASSEKGKRFNTECTEENRRTQRKITAYCKFKGIGKCEESATPTSWQAGAALRSRAAGSQDESRCSAIHKKRPTNHYQCHGARTGR